MLSSSGSASHSRPGAAGSPAELQVVVSVVDGEHEVRLVGELDLGTAPKLRDELARLTADGARLVTVDMRELSFIDSTGLSVLITGLKRLRQDGGDMTLRSPTPGTLKVLEITGLTEVFTIS